MSILRSPSVAPHQPSRRPSGLSRRSPTATALLRGVPWVLIGSVVSQGSTLLCGVIGARILGKNAFGQFGIVQSTALTVASVAGAGLGVTATRYVAELKHTDPNRAGRLVGLVSMVAAGGRRYLRANPVSPRSCNSPARPEGSQSWAIAPNWLAVPPVCHPQRLSDRHACRVQAFSSIAGLSVLQGVLAVALDAPPHDEVRRRGGRRPLSPYRLRWVGRLPKSSCE